MAPGEAVVPRETHRVLLDRAGGELELTCDLCRQRLDIELKSFLCGAYSALKMAQNRVQTALISVKTA